MCSLGDIRGELFAHFDKIVADVLYPGIEKYVLEDLINRVNDRVGEVMRDRAPHLVDDIVWSVNRVSGSSLMIKFIGQTPEAREWIGCGQK